MHYPWHREYFFKMNFKTATAWKFFEYRLFPVHIFLFSDRKGKFRNKKNSVFRHFSPIAQQSITQVSHLSFDVNTCFGVYIGLWSEHIYFLLFYEMLFSYSLTPAHAWTLCIANKFGYEFLTKFTGNTPWVLLKSALFSPEISKFYFIKKYRYRFHFDT